MNDKESSAEETQARGLPVISRDQEPQLAEREKGLTPDNHVTKRNATEDHRGRGSETPSALNIVTIGR